MPIVYSIKENKALDSLENSYWTISVCVTDLENTYSFVQDDKNVIELSRYGPIATLEEAKYVLHTFADQIDEVSQYGKGQYGPTLVFKRHPLLAADQRDRRAAHYNMAV